MFCFCFFRINSTVFLVGRKNTCCPRTQDTLQQRHWFLLLIVPTNDIARFKYAADFFHQLLCRMLLFALKALFHLPQQLQYLCVLQHMFIRLVFIPELAIKNI